MHRGVYTKSVKYSRLVYLILRAAFANIVDSLQDGKINNGNLHRSDFSINF